LGGGDGGGGVLIPQEVTTLTRAFPAHEVLMTTLPCMISDEMLLLQAVLIGCPPSFQ